MTLESILGPGIAWAIVPARVDAQARARYEAWLARGRHADMRCLTDYAAVKFDPGMVVGGARSLVLLAVPLPPAREALPDPAGAMAGRIARHAQGRDYHKVVGGLLGRLGKFLENEYPGEIFRPVCDTVPLSERYFAARGGLGTRLASCLLGNSSFGTRFVLGGLVTTAALEPRDAGCAVREDACKNCGLCRAACPTGALVAPGDLDVARCIAWLTIEYKGLIDPVLWPAIGENLFGCDICQDCCPLNEAFQPVSSADKAADLCLEDRFATPNASGPDVSLAEIFSLVDDAAVRARFAGTALLRAGRRGLIRNGLIVATNLRASGLGTQIANLVTDNDPVIAETARIARDMPG